jgi:thiol:disulfide interchange protein DsbD
MRLLLTLLATLPLVGGVAGCSKASSAEAVVHEGDSKAPASEAWEELGGEDAVDAQLERLLTAAKADQRPAVVDFWAEWCMPCKEMDKTVFPTPPVKKALERFAKVKIDTTADTEAIQTVQKRYSVTSMPTILFFGPDGALLDELRVTEKIDSAGLVARLEKVPAP